MFYLLRSKSSTPKFVLLSIKILSKFHFEFSFGCGIWFLSNMKFLGKPRLVKFSRTLFDESQNNRSYTSVPSTVGDFLESWKAKLRESKIPEAEATVQIIASHVLNISKIDKLPKLYSEELTVDQRNRITLCCERKLARIPLQYIIQEWDFRNVTLRMSPPVFIPRPETELLIDIVKQNVEKLDHALEIGCGSGAVSISLLNENERLRITAIDQSRLACDLTVQNAILNNVNDRLEVRQKRLQDDGSIDEFHVDEVDTIVSNPPYVFSSEIRDLEPEVKLYEDLRALDGGSDGLRVIKAVLKYSSVTLAPGKSCFLEIHHQHVSMIAKWLSENVILNLRITQTFKDLFGYDRFVSITKIR